jgi:hypothetical protein
MRRSVAWIELDLSDVGKMVGTAIRIMESLQPYDTKDARNMSIFLIGTFTTDMGLRSCKKLSSRLLTQA